jgi:hypothetical protein
VLVLVVAAPLLAAPNTVAPTAPPASSDPAIAAVVRPLRSGFMPVVSFACPASLDLEAWEPRSPSGLSRRWEEAESSPGVLGSRLWFHQPSRG